MLSLTHAAGGAERNWSTHGFINADQRKGQQKPVTLERLVRLYRNSRLRDRALLRGRQAQKQQQEPKAYPLERGDWSSCDDSEDETVWDAAVAAYGFGPEDRRRFKRADAGPAGRDAARSPSLVLSDSD